MRIEAIDCFLSQKPFYTELNYSSGWVLVRISSNLITQVPGCKQKQESCWDGPFGWEASSENIKHFPSLTGDCMNARTHTRTLTHKLAHKCTHVHSGLLVCMCTYACLCTQVRLLVVITFSFLLFSFFLFSFFFFLLSFFFFFFSVKRQKRRKGVVWRKKQGN